MIVCLSGWKQSGKDTVAEYLISRHAAIRVALADPLKNSVAEEFGIKRSSLDDPKTKESPILNMPVQPKDGYSKMIAEFLIKEFRTADGFQCKEFSYKDGLFVGLTDNGFGLCQVYWTPRALAILKGSTNRSVTSNFWTQQAFNVIQAELNENSNQIVVVTDVRYKSELTQFKEKFGDKAIFIRINRHTTSPSNDPSERDLDDGVFDFHIDNTSGISYLQEQIEGILAQLK